MTPSPSTIDQEVLDLSPDWTGFLYVLSRINGSFSRSASLSLWLDVQNGQSGYLRFGTLSEANTQSVPAPAPWFLLLPFLAALLVRKEVCY